MYSQEICVHDLTHKAHQNYRPRGMEVCAWSMIITDDDTHLSSKINSSEGANSRPKYPKHINILEFNTMLPCVVS